MKSLEEYEDHEDALSSCVIVNATHAGAGPLLLAPGRVGLNNDSLSAF